MKQIPDDLTAEGLRQWLDAYPIPIEDFGKDWVNAHYMLLGYSTDNDAAITLRQALNTTRRILLNTTHGTFDVLTADNKKWHTNESIVLVVEDDNGEQYEDYQRWVDRTYIVNTNKTGEQIETEWKKHVADVMLENNITVNPHYINTIMSGSKVRNKKLHKKIIKENGFCKWLESTYNAKEITHTITHPIQL